MKPLHFNPDSLKKIIGSDKNIMIALLVDMVKGSTKNFDLLKLNFEAQNWNSLKGNAHFLKSNFRYLGNQRMAEILKTIENSAPDESKRQEIPDLMSEFVTVFPEVMKEVEEYIEFLKAA